MSRNASWKSWAIILAVLVGSGILTAIWPLLGTLTGSSTGSPSLEASPPIELSLPFGGAEPIVLTSLQAIGILAVIVIGAVVVFGLPLALIYTRLEQQTNTVMASDDFKTKQSALEEKEKNRLKEMQADRESSDNVFGKYVPQWSSISTALVILLFAAFFGMLIGRTFYPEGEIITNSGGIINVNLIIVGATAILALLTTLWFIRPQRMEAVDETDRSGIPWDFIWVLLTGLLVVGLGLAAVVYLNVPS